MAFLQAWFSQPKLVANFKHTTFEFVAKDVHRLDQIDMHMEVGDMVYLNFTQTAIMASKLQVTLNNV